MVMKPRVTKDKDRFLAALRSTNPFNQTRLWELTNVRYLLGDGGDQFVEMLNRLYDPVQKRFRLFKLPNGDSANFNITTKPNPGNPLSLVDLTVTPNPNGELGH